MSDLPTLPEGIEYLHLSIPVSLERIREDTAAAADEVAGVAAETARRMVTERGQS